MRNAYVSQRFFRHRHAPARGAGALLALCVALGAFAQETEPIVGVWRMNIPESAFSPAEAPVQSTTRIEMIDGGLRVVNEGIDAQGRRTRNEYTAMFDGEDHPARRTIDGRLDVHAPDAVILNRLDERNYEIIRKRQGEVVVVTRWTISADGRTRTAQCQPIVAEHACPPMMRFEKQ